MKRAFISHFRKSKTASQLNKLSHNLFYRVYKRFEKNGIGQSHVSPNKGKDHSDGEKESAISNFFIEFPFASLYEASKELKIPKNTIRWYLTRKLKMYPYKLSFGQALSQAHEAGRLTFSEWLLSQPNPSQFVQLVIFEGNF